MHGLGRTPTSSAMPSGIRLRERLPYATALTTRITGADSRVAMTLARSDAVTWVSTCRNAEPMARRPSSTMVRFSLSRR